MKNFSTQKTIEKMRTVGQVIYIADTETTGFNVSRNLESEDGDRMIEFGAIKMIAQGGMLGFREYELTDERTQMIFNPGRPTDAVHIHGLTDEILANKPRFEDRAEAFINQIRGSVMIFHNAPFDVKFLDHELMRAGFGRLTEYCDVFDTLFYAQNKLGAGKAVNLDALSKHYKVEDLRSEFVGESNGEAELLTLRRQAAGRIDVHGADVDALLLAKVFLAMTENGHVNDLILGLKQPPEPMTGKNDQKRAINVNMAALPLVGVPDDAKSEHSSRLKSLGWENVDLEESTPSPSECSI